MANVIGDFEPQRGDRVEFEIQESKRKPGNDEAIFGEIVGLSPTQVRHVPATMFAEVFAWARERPATKVT